MIIGDKGPNFTVFKGYIMYPLIRSSRTFQHSSYVRFLNRNHLCLNQAHLSRFRSRGAG